MGEKIGPVLPPAGSGGGGGSGTVTSVSVVSANGLSGTVATSTTTPAITLAPTFTGITYSNGSAFQAAVAGNFPTLNQNTTGTAANLSGTPALPNGTTATTQSPGDTTTKLATDAFVAAAIIAAPQSAQYTTSTITADPNPGVVGTYYRANYAASGSFTLPSSGLTAGNWILVKNIANNTLTFVGTVDGSTSFGVSFRQSVLLIWNGSNWDAN